MLIQNIQVLRFFAAFLVLLHHTLPPNVHPAHYADIPRFITEISLYGFAGVDVFFVISGFIMAETTRAMHTQGSAAVAGSFVLRRFWRIFSGYWPVFALMLVLSAWLGVFQEPGISRTASFFLLPQPFYFLNVSWSLSYELYFYLILGAALLIPRRQAVLVLGLAFFALAAWVFWNYLHAGYRTLPEYGRLDFLFQVFLTSPLILEFMAGFFLSEWFARRPNQILWLWVVGTLIAIAASVYVHRFGNLPGVGMAALPHYPERVLFFGSASVGLVAVAALAPPWRSPLWRLLQHLGDASYALYLLHIPLLVIFYGVVFPRIDGFLFMAGGTWALLAYLLGCVVVSWLYFKAVEQPLNRLGRRWAPAPRAA